MSNEFEDFESSQAVLAWLEQSKQENLRMVKMLDPAQQRVTWGSCWIRFWKEFAIFGRVLTQTELFEQESGTLPDPGAPDYEEAVAEVNSTLATLRESNTYGYVYGWCHSKVEAAELGSTHRSSLWPISDALFAHAAENGWDPDQMRPIFRLEVAIAYDSYSCWADKVAAEASRAFRRRD